MATKYLKKEIISVADRWCLSQIQIFPSRIQSQKDSSSGSTSKNLSIFTQKIVSKLSEIWSMCISDPDLGFLPILDPGPKRPRMRNTGYFFLGPSSFLFTVIRKLNVHLPLVVIRRLGEWRNRTGAMPRAAVSTIPLPTFRPPPTRPSCCYSHPQRGRRRGWFSPWCGVSFRPGTMGRIPREAAYLPEPVYSRQNFISRQYLFPAKNGQTGNFSCPSACSYGAAASYPQ